MVPPSDPLDEPAAAKSHALDGEHRALSPFELTDRLVQAWSRNERRLGELDGLEASLAAARDRLATTAAGRLLAEVHLARLTARRQTCLAEARADARLADQLAREWDSRQVVRRAVGG